MQFSESSHLSHEVGHTSGLARTLLGVGLVLLLGGLTAFLVGVGVGIVSAADGAGNDSGGLWLLGVGGSTVVVGLLVAAAGMALGRHDADE